MKLFTVPRTLVLPSVANKRYSRRSLAALSEEQQDEFDFEICVPETLDAWLRGQSTEFLRANCNWDNPYCRFSGSTPYVGVIKWQATRVTPHGHYVITPVGEQGQDLVEMYPW